MTLTKDEPKSIEIENGIVKITFVNNNPYSNKIDENPIIRTIEFQSDTLQIMKEDAEKWRWNKKNCPSLTESVEIVERLKKRIEELNEVAVEDFNTGHSNQNVEFRIEELQKILGEEDNVTAHIGGVTFGEEK